jgi:hypothetical protein
MDLTGTITVVMPAQSGVSQRSGNAWMSQEYVMEIPGQWPRHIVFRIFGEDRIKQFNIQQGEQNVTIQFDIDAHEYNGRWFNEIRCYNVLRSVGQQPYQQQAQPSAVSPQTSQSPFPPQANAQSQSAGQQGADDLPF